MPRPRSLTPEQLAAAALAVTDRQGLAGLSMRAVATELGLSTMALYRYVQNREELELLVAERVLSGADVAPSRPGAPWREQLGELALRMRDSVRAHPAAVPLTITHRHRCPSALRWSETVLGVLTEAGFTGRARVLALRSLLSHLIGAVQLDHLGSLTGAHTAALAGLPQERYPLLSATAGDALDVAADEEFTRGLSVVLHGLDALRD